MSDTRNIDYRCTRCGTAQQRDDLTAKRAQFTKMGVKGKVLRSRVVDWLCPACLAVDPDYDRPKLSASPGMADTRIAVRPESIKPAVEMLGKMIGIIQ